MMQVDSRPGSGQDTPRVRSSAAKDIDNTMGETVEGKNRYGLQSSTRISTDRDEAIQQTPSSSLETCKRAIRHEEPQDQPQPNSSSWSSKLRISASASGLPLPPPSAPTDDANTMANLRVKSAVASESAFATTSAPQFGPHTCETSITDAASVVEPPMRLHSTLDSTHLSDVMPAPVSPGSQPSNSTTSFRLPLESIHLSPASSTTHSDSKHPEVQLANLPSTVTAKSKINQVEPEHLHRPLSLEPSDLEPSNRTRSVVACTPSIACKRVRYQRHTLSPSGLRSSTTSTCFSDRLAWRKRKQATRRIVAKRAWQLCTALQRGYWTRTCREQCPLRNASQKMTRTSKIYSKKNAKVRHVADNTRPASAEQSDKGVGGAAPTSESAIGKPVAKSRRSRGKPKPSSKKASVVRNEKLLQEKAIQPAPRQTTKGSQTPTVLVENQVAKVPQGNRPSIATGASVNVDSVQLAANDKRESTGTSSMTGKHRTAMRILAQSTPPSQEIEEAGSSSGLQRATQREEDQVSVGDLEKAASAGAGNRPKEQASTSESDKCKVQMISDDDSVTEESFSTERGAGKALIATAPSKAKRHEDTMQSAGLSKVIPVSDAAQICFNEVSATALPPTEVATTPAQVNKNAKDPVLASGKAPSAPETLPQTKDLSHGASPAPNLSSASVQLGSREKAATLRKPTAISSLVAEVSSLDESLLCQYINIPTTAELLNKPTRTERMTTPDSEDDVYSDGRAAEPVRPKRAPARPRKRVLSPSSGGNAAERVRPKRGPGRPRKRVLSPSDDGDYVFTDAVRPKRGRSVAKADHEGIVPDAQEPSGRLARGRQDDIDDDFDVSYSDLERLESKITGYGNEDASHPFIVDEAIETDGDSSYLEEVEVVSTRRRDAAATRKRRRERSSRRLKRLVKGGRRGHSPSPALLNVYSQDVSQSRQPSLAGSSTLGAVPHVHSRHYSPLPSDAEDTMSVGYIASSPESLSSRIKRLRRRHGRPASASSRPTHSPSPPRTSQVNSLEKKILSDVEQMKEAFGSSSLHFVRGQQAYDRVAFNLASVDKPSPGKGYRINAYAEFMAQLTRWINVSAAAIERMLEHGGAPPSLEIPFEEVRPPPKAR